MKLEKRKTLYGALTLLGAAISIALDQWFKYLTVALLKPIHIYPLWDGVFQLTYVENPGAAFGIFSGETNLLVWVTAILLCLMILAVLFQKLDHPLLFWSFGLIIGGGIGNLIDRVLYGYVVDYLHVTLINFAVFNFADCCVVIGAGLLLLYFLFFDSESKKEKSVSKEKAPEKPTEESDA